MKGGDENTIPFFSYIIHVYKCSVIENTEMFAVSLYTILSTESCSKSTGSVLSSGHNSIYLFQWHPHLHHNLNQAQSFCHLKHLYKTARLDGSHLQIIILVLYIYQCEHSMENILAAGKVVIVMSYVL